MAATLICKCAMFLAVIACQILYPHARPLRSSPTDEYEDLVHTSVAAATKTGSDETWKPVADPNQRKPSSSGSEAAPDSDKEDFRPTTPGSSPGVGHAFEEQSRESDQKTEGATDDFRPTAPGHSPGAGHTIHNKSAGTA